MVSINEVKTRYDQDYKDGKFGGPGFLHRWILDLLSIEDSKNLLDIGCGQGFLLREARARGLKTFGIDVSKEAVAIAKRNSPDSVIICDNAEKLSWQDNSFDYITNIGSLEHFLSPENCLKEMRRTLKPDGEAVIMLPNLYYYRHILDKIFKGKSPTSYQAVERFEKRKVWQDFLDKNGFQIISVHKYNKFNRKKLMVWIRSIIIPIDFSHHFVFICRKK